MIDSQLAQQIARTIADEIGAQPAQARAAIALLDEGASVPFIARYRKEVTGGLDDTQLRNLETRLTYLRELEERRAAILSSIGEQGKLSDELRDEIGAADTKSRLEDLYLPYKPKRRTRAQIAREAGLEPLADGLLADPSQAPEVAAAPFIDADKGVADIKAALEGARAILMERWGEDAALVGELRSWLNDNGVIRARVAEGKEEAGAKYRDYFDHVESLAKIPSHRLLALFRARREEFLYLDLDPGSDAEAGHQYAEGRVALSAGVSNEGRPADRWLLDACRLTWRAKLHMHLLLDLFNQAREKAEAEAIAVFGDNLKDLMLAAPAGARVAGLDPGIRTGCKIAVVDATGKLVATETIYPHEPKRQWDQSLQTIKQLCLQHNVELIAIGNGTASRETDKLAGEAITLCGAAKLQKVVVSEAGASVYSASEFAAKEFPNLDVSLRGAVSIARRLQDPLAELVKIEPKAIGVGQYQHDVDQYRLAKALEARVEDCVNAVGVYVNTASAALLSRVSGLSSDGGGKHRAPSRRQWSVQAPQGLAQSAAPGRQDLRAVRRFPAHRRWRRAAGRVGGASGSLSGGRAHRRQHRQADQGLAGRRQLSARAQAGAVHRRAVRCTDRARHPQGAGKTRPRSAPRVQGRAVCRRHRGHQASQARYGAEGVVSNVAAFGAFVDIGVHQDGLVHISALSDTFVKDPRDVVKAGDIVKVKVLEVDVARKRIALTCRLSDTPPPADAAAQSRDQRGNGGPGQGRRDGGGGGRGPGQGNNKPRTTAPPADNALAAAFARAKRT